MLDEEKARAIAAIKEAESNTAKVDMFERQAENAQNTVLDKERRI